MNSARVRTAAGLAALAASFVAFSWFYIARRQGFFDDVFIYLHIARNGADDGTWQYFTVVDRPALLASSPFKIVLLTLAAWITKVSGWGGRSFLEAKLVLVAYAPLAWLAWAPFWRGRLLPFLWLGVAFFVLALCLDAAVDFEGGLLFLWLATLAMLLGDPRANRDRLGWAIPLGLVIRPDVALPALVALAIVLGREHVVPVARSALYRGLALAAAWLLVCAFMGVWPIPTTYWAKAAIRQLVEQRYMIEVFFERLGAVTAGRLAPTPSTATAIGTTIVFGFVLAACRDARTRLAAAAALGVSVLLLARAPANFWWYYQNIALALLGVSAGMLLRGRPEPNQAVVPASVAPMRLFLAFAAVVLLVGKAGTDGPDPWRMDGVSRAQGYLYLASRAVGDGTYDLGSLGRVIVRNPEIGMSAFFADGRAWIWDSAGLAQPLDDPKVKASPLRHFFPPGTRRPAIEDARRISEQAGVPLRVVDAWAMEDRDFDAARSKCAHVIVEGAICANEFAVQN